MGVLNVAESGQILRYLKQGVDTLLEQGIFDGGQEFRPTQRQALGAYKKYLNKCRLPAITKADGVKLKVKTIAMGYVPWDIIKNNSKSFCLKPNFVYDVSSKLRRAFCIEPSLLY